MNVAQKATTIQAKIFSDATRFTYGDAHMEDPLKALKLAPRGMGPPDLINIAESVTENGEYCMTLRFFAPNTPYRVWQVWPWPWPPETLTTLDRGPSRP